MSAVDNRVVQMEFDNSRFERNVHTSISTLDRLKAALKFKGASDGLNTIENNVKGFNLNGIGSAVETISGKFSALGVIGMTALQNITNKAISAGEHLVKSLSLDQINAGWDKYAEKTTSVQTIMAATEKTWEQSAKNMNFVGSQMDFVNSQMDKLNWFTDETSYSFTDMVSNIGKFTANNIPLETSVTAMQGIATWAAISGQNAGAASRAMYNLAQSIGVGAVKLMDWKSIENANMATAGFKERVLEVATANGQLTKEVNKAGETIYKTTKGTEVSVESFSQTLSEGWFDKNTLLSVLDDYGSFTNQLYEYSEASGLTASEILSLSESYENLEKSAKEANVPVEDFIKNSKEGSEYTKELKKTADEYGLSVDDLAKNIANLGSEENEFGRKAFKAAQEAKTFQDAIDATKDAASTRWMNIFENIFGDYEKARHVWTDFANFLYDLLVSPLDGLETISEYFGKWDGLTMIRNSFSDISSFLKGDGEVPGILSSIKEGFEQVIPPLEITEGKVGSVLYKIRRFAASLKLSEEQAERFRAAGAGLANIISFIGNSMRNLWNATSGLRSALGNLAGAVGNAVLGLFGMASDMDNTGIKGEAFRKVCDSVASVINTVADAIRGIDFTKLKQNFSGVTGIFKGVSTAIGWVIDTITNVDFSAAFGTVIDWIKQKFESLRTFLSGFDFGKIFKGAAGTGILALIGTKLYKSIKNITSPFESFKGIGEKVSGILEGISGALKSFETGIKVDSFKKIATSILILAGALLVLGFVNYDNAINGIVAIGAIMAGLFAVFQAIDKLKMDKVKLATLATSMLMTAAAMLVMAASLAVLAGALALFTLVSRMDDVGKGFAIMAGTLAVALVGLKVMSKMSPKVIVAAAALAVFAASLLLLAAAVAAFALVAKMNTVWQGLAVMAAGLVVVIAALAILGKIALGALAGAAALLVVSAALLVLAGALAAFSAVAGMETFGTGLAAMALTILVLVAALIALGAAGPLVLVGAAAMLVAAAACVVLAGAIAAVGLAMPLLALGLASLGTAIGSALGSIGTGVGTFLTGVSAGILAAGQAIGGMVSEIGSGIGEAVAALGAGVGESISSIIASVGVGIGNGITAISDAIGSFGENLTQAGNGITELGNGVRSLEGISWGATALGIGELALALGKLKPEELATSMGGASIAVVTMCNDMVVSLTTSVPLIMTASQELGSTIATGIESKKVEVQNAVMGMVQAGRNTLSGQSWYSLGANLAQGFANGIRSRIGEVSSAASAMASAATRSVTIAIDAHSPSRVTTRLGDYFGQGFANGIASQTSNVESAARKMANNSINAVSTAKNLITSMLEQDFTPVITPVLNTSNISSSLGGLSGLDVSAGISRVGNVSNVGNDLSSEIQNGSNTSSAGASYVFNQYNTSPKSLSRIEIYRQTKNLISMQREAASV